MIAAFAAVTIQTFWNRLWWRLRKLRQARYAVGAVAGALYFWFAVFRNAHRVRVWSAATHSELMIDVLSLAVLSMIILAWALPGDSGGLDFSEAEIAFLFPAPLSRRNLLLYKIIRAQPSAIISAMVMTIFALRGNFVGLWIGFSVLGMYFTMVSLGRARLRLAGVNVIWRVVGVVVVLAVLSAGATLSLQSSSLRDFEQPGASPLHRGWMATLLFVPRLAVSAVFPGGMPSLAVSAAGLIAIGVVFFFVALRLNVSFEEASVERSRRRAERRQRFTSRRSGTRVMFERVQSPFRLAETGPAESAIVWKNTIAFLRISLAWAVVLVVVVVAAVGMGIFWPDPHARVSFAFLLTAVAAMFPLIGPNIFRNDLRLDLSRMELLKSYPIAGDRLVAAEIAAPLAVISVFELAFLSGASLLMNLAPAGGRLRIIASPQLIVAALLFAVPICALQLLIRNAVPVIFPAWATRSKEDPRGFVMFGQRLVVLGGNLLVLAVGLVPAAMVFIPSLWIAFRFFSGSPGLVAVGTLPAIAVIVAEVWFGTQLLGAQFERLDVAADLDTVAI
ncbi:MAG: putative ABC exporter domain-containing protein [Thermoanaerobaculia bacterium]